VSEANSVSWSPDGKYLAAGGNNGEKDVIVYQWDGINLTQLATKPFGIATSVSWSPDGAYLAVGGQNGDEDVAVYQLFQNTLTYNPTNDKSILFGNSALGSSYNLGINLMKDAKVTVNGTVFTNKS
ncbi:MAG: hypothetical protein ABH827_02650, partial [bacterium]